jgi:hypothetical protein
MSTTSRRSTKRFRRTVGWGEALVLEVHYRSPGLSPVVKAIHSAVGKSIGVRNTFAKLYDYEQPPADTTEQFRAWLVLTALGQDPSAWGISDEVVPKGYDLETLRTLVRSHSPWITTHPDQLSLELAA